jgi:transcriptional regulator with XRE-family HTH domain
MSLRKLRKAIGKTQTAVAKRLKVGQDAVSKIETRSDMYVSTLRDFIKAMGGELELVAQFPDRPPVRLEALGTAPARRKRLSTEHGEKSASTKSAAARVSVTRS